MEERISILEAKFETVEKMYEIAMNSIQSQSNFLMWFIGFGIPLVSIIVGTVAVRQYVRTVVEKNLEEKLISLYEKNPPTFSHDEKCYLGENRVIMFDSDTKGITQLNAKTLVQLTIYTVDPSIKQQRLLGIIENNEETKLPFVSLLTGDDVIGKLVYVSLTWKRTKIEK